MNVAIVLAGGSGKRMRMDTPKQFVRLYGKPILVYTMESFEKNPSIDVILAVVLAGWQDAVRGYREEFGLSKLKWIVAGGDTVQESIRNGVFALESICAPDDVIVLHDGVRPLVEQSVLDDVLAVCKKHGNAVSSLPYNEQLFLTSDDVSTTKYIPREVLRRVTTPQAYRFSELDLAYHEAFNKGIGIHGSAYANTLMADLGKKLYFAAGSERNSKITTREDLEAFRAYLERSHNG